jgi:hypothetical protein
MPRASADSDLCATGSIRTLRSCDGLADRRADSIVPAIDVAGRWEAQARGRLMADSKHILPRCARGER